MELHKTTKEGKFGHQITYEYIRINSVSTSINFNNSYNNVINSPLFISVFNRIYSNVNSQPRCLNCGKISEHNHHIIPNVNPIHPCGFRLMEYITIPLCRSCHGSNGGKFHRINDDYDDRLSKKYRDIVSEKYELVHSLLNEIDILCINYETELANLLLDDLLTQSRPPLQTLPENESGEVV